MPLENAENNQSTEENDSQKPQSEMFPDIAQESNRLMKKRRDEKQVRQAISIEQALGELSEGTKISIWRMKPSWCSGHVATIEMVFDDDGSPLIDLEDIKEQFGGHTLQLKFLDAGGCYLTAKTVTFGSRPPKENGEILKSPEEKRREEEMQLERMRLLNAQQSHSDETMKMMMQMFAAMQSNKPNDNSFEMMKMFSNQLTDLNAQRLEILQESANKTNPDPLQQMTNTLKMMDMMKKTFGGNEPVEKDGDDMTKMVAGIMQMMGSQKQQAPPAHVPQPNYRPTQRPPIRTVTPVSIQKPIPEPHTPPKQANENTEKQIEAVPDIDIEKTKKTVSFANQSEDDIIDTLAGMSSADLASIVSEVLGQMDDEKQMAVFQAFEKIGEGGEPE